MRTRTKAILMVLASATLIAAAAGARHRTPRLPSGTSTVEITAREYGFTGPDTIPAGLTELRLVNAGSELHHLQLVWLDEGRTATQLVAAIAGGPPPDWADMIGGPNAIAPGTSAASIQELRPGHYAILCFIPSADGVHHFAKGMHRDLWVTGTSVPAAEPRADVEIRLVDYAFVLSAPLAVGRQMLEVQNAGPQTHEVELLRLLPGRSLPDWDRWVRQGMKGPAPAVLIGGIAGLAPGRHAYFTAQIEPGKHVLICYVPDARDGKSHKAHGMVREIEVGGV
jgi:uncharacterized cupredoxin-like copper-binding protein